jgi:hypothetical protein
VINAQTHYGTARSKIFDYGVRRYRRRRDALAMPYLVNDTLSKRMKAVAFEREKIRQRERERLAQGSRAALRQSPRAYMKTIVDNFNLSKWVGQEEAHTMLLQAGYRGQAPYVTYLFFRMVMPVVMLVCRCSTSSSSSSSISRP